MDSFWIDSEKKRFESRRRWNHYQKLTNTLSKYFIVIVQIILNKLLQNSHLLVIILRPQAIKMQYNSFQLYLHRIKFFFFSFNFKTNLISVIYFDWNTFMQMFNIIVFIFVWNIVSIICAWIVFISFYVNIVLRFRHQMVAALNNYISI